MRVSQSTVVFFEQLQCSVRFCTIGDNTRIANELCRREINCISLFACTEMLVTMDAHIGAAENPDHGPL